MLHYQFGFHLSFIVCAVGSAGKGGSGNPVFGRMAPGQLLWNLGYANDDESIALPAGRPVGGDLPFHVNRFPKGI
jgi:hypothetical protein